LRIVVISLALCYTSDMLIQCSQTSRDQSPAVCVSVLFQISDENFSFDGKKIDRLRTVFLGYFMPLHWLVNFLTMVCGRSQRHLVNKKTLKISIKIMQKKCGYYNKFQLHYGSAHRNQDMTPFRIFKDYENWKTDACVRECTHLLPSPFVLFRSSLLSSKFCRRTERKHRDRPCEFCRRALQ
jgi:hypothetical protein